MAAPKLVFDWEYQAEDDFKAENMGYLLHAEQLDNSLWFYSVYYANQEVWASYLDTFGTVSESDAKKKAEAKANEHFVKYIHVED